MRMMGSRCVEEDQADEGDWVSEGWYIRQRRRRGCCCKQQQVKGTERGGVDRAHRVMGQRRVVEEAGRTGGGESAGGTFLFRHVCPTL